jgi:hypothetical protein
MTGWGAILFFRGTSSWVGAQWEPSAFHRCIAELEAFAVLYGLQLLLPDGGPVHIIVDNTTVAGAIRRRRSTAFHLNNVIKEVTAHCFIRSITYVRSEYNPADPISRGRPPDFSGSSPHAEAAKLICLYQPSWREYL